MDPTILSAFLPLIAYSAFVGVCTLAIIVEWQLWVMRHAQKRMEAAILDRLGNIEKQQERGASNAAALTTQFHRHQEVTMKKFEDLANRQEIVTMMNNGFTQMAVMLFGTRTSGTSINVAGQTGTQDSGRQGGADFHGPTTVQGAMAAGDIQTATGHYGKEAKE